MKIREKITLESCVKWFAALCTASLLVASVPFTFFLYQLLLMLSVFFGAGLLLWLFLVDRRVYRRPFFPIFLLFYVFTSLFFSTPFPPLGVRCAPLRSN